MLRRQDSAADPQTAHRLQVKLRTLTSSVLLALVLHAPLGAQVAPAPAHAAADSSRPPIFTHGDWVAIGAVTAGTLLLSIWDDDIADWVNQPSVQNNGFLKTSRSFANRINESTMGVGSLALWGVARLTKQKTLADISIHITEAVVAASLSAQIVRGPLGRARPSAADSLQPDDYNQYIFHPFQGFTSFSYRSFPSIHTASGFAAAAVLSEEAARRWPDQYKWISPLAYALAATPGLARMHLNQHWASDVLMGALFGTMAGRGVVRYNHDVNPGNKVDRFLLGAGGVSHDRLILFEVTRTF